MQKIARELEKANRNIALLKEEMVKDEREKMRQDAMPTVVGNELASRPATTAESINIIQNLRDDAVQSLLEDRTVYQQELDEVNSRFQAESANNPRGPQFSRMATQLMLQGLLQHLEIAAAEVEQVMDNILQHVSNDLFHGTADQLRALIADHLNPIWSAYHDFKIAQQEQ